ncbi:MAG: CAP domain-containing protein [Gaiellales bacterium]
MKVRNLVASVLATAVMAITLAVPAHAATNATYRWQLYLQINKVRAAYGLPRVYIATGLRDAAQRHSQDMVSRDYFSHTSPTGSTLYYRIVHSPFLRVGAWSAGETLAWGTGSVGSPATIVRMWLDSPEHRAIMLSRCFTCIGMGRSVGSFLGRPGAVVWTADWGHH